MSALPHHEALAVVDELVDRLRTLSAEDIRRAGLLIRTESRSAADEIEWWSATVRVAHVLRHQHRRLTAAQATAAGTEAVKDAASRAGLAADDPDVIATARAAADAAAAVVAIPATTAEARYFLTRLGLGLGMINTSTTSPAAA